MRPSSHVARAAKASGEARPRGGLTVQPLARAHLEAQAHPRSTANDAEPPHHVEQGLVARRRRPVEPAWRRRRLVYVARHVRDAVEAVALWAEAADRRRQRDRADVLGMALP